MESMKRSVRSVEPAYARPIIIKTTLYELIRAIGEEVQPGEDRLVAAVVLCLFETGKVNFIGEPIMC